MRAILLVIGSWSIGWSSPALAEPLSGIVYVPEGYLLGGVRGKRVVDEKSASAALRGGERYRLFGFARPVGSCRGAKRPRREEACTTRVKIDLADAPDSAVIALGGAWPALPRRVRQTRDARPEHRQAARELLERNRLRRPSVEVDQVITADLDGDGQQEVVVVANRHLKGVGAPRTSAGDYSVVFARKLVDSKLQTIVLDAEYSPQAHAPAAPSKREVIAVLDVDGDGQLELVVRSKYYEGWEVAIFRVVGARAIKLLQGGCGA